jgi:glutamate synthase domain-containing protein 3
MAKQVAIDGKGVHYTPLNQQIRKAVADGADEIVISNVLGQRFIGDGLRGNITIHIHGVPGGDLAIFMSGPTIIVHGNAEHAPGNTMDAGKVVIHGNAGDAVAYSMRGGKVFVRGDIGYRGGIHMKQYEDRCPILVIGGTAQAYLGEYMAGGLLLVLGLHGPIKTREIGSGIHGGEIIIRGDVDDACLATGATKVPLTDEDRARIAPVIREFAGDFGLDPEPLINVEYTRIIPASARPFVGKYTWE